MIGKNTLILNSDEMNFAMTSYVRERLSSFGYNAYDKVVNVKMAPLRKNENRKFVIEIEHEDKPKI